MSTPKTLNEEMNEDSPAKRFSVELQFEIKRNYARQCRWAEIKNISATGALIRTDQPLKPSEKINVYLTVSGRTRKVAAKVVWVGERSVHECGQFWNYMFVFVNILI